MCGQLCVGVADGVVADADLDDGVELVVVDCDGVLLCVEAMATPAVPAAAPPAKTATMAALDNRDLVTNAMGVPFFSAGRGSARDG